MRNANKKLSFYGLGAILFLMLFLFGWRLSHPTVAAVRSTPAPAAGLAAGPAVSDVEMVKSSTLPERPAKTIGAAFESAFQDPQWRAFADRNGERAVEFRGKVKYTAFRDAGFYLGPWNGVQQGVEFEQASAARKAKCVSEAGGATKPEDTGVSDCVAKAEQDVVIPVTFQFTYAPDRKHFELTEMDAVFQKFDPDHRLRSYRAATLAFIYQDVPAQQ